MSPSHEFEEAKSKARLQEIIPSSRFDRRHAEASPVRDELDDPVLEAADPQS
jgi:hypothetical protein